MFRFTIRDVLWLMVVVGMGLGWRAEHAHIKRLKDEVTKWHDACLSLAEHVKISGVKVSFRGEPVYQIHVVHPDRQQTTIHFPNDPSPR
jgi:hypothetical protein